MHCYIEYRPAEFQPARSKSWSRSVCSTPYCTQLPCSKNWASLQVYGLIDRAHICGQLASAFACDIAQTRSHIVRLSLTELGANV